MRELSSQEIENVAGAMHLKLHVNVFQAIFTVIGAGILGGPVGAGVAVAAAIGAQSLGNLHEMYVDEFGNRTANANET
ncbi:MAG: hypothetical protein HYX61_11220 [Gammaproteobacteria bacterium]|jgi:hypothetical protein|nr:hypothetical protein [Gammaproteobacteria bacterium]